MATGEQGRYGVRMRGEGEMSRVWYDNSLLNIIKISPNQEIGHSIVHSSNGQGTNAPA